MKDQKMNETEETTEMNAVPPSIGGDQAAQAEPNPGKRKKMIVVTLIAAVVAIALCVGGWLWFSSHQHSVALDECTSALNDYKTKAKGFAASRKDAEETAKVTVDQVKDTKTVAALAADMKISAKVYGSTATVCKTTDNTQTLNNTASHLKADGDELAATGIRISQETKAVTASKTAKEIDDTTTLLADKITAAQGTLDSTSGKVSDNSVRDALQNEINAETTMRDDAKRTVAGMTDEINKLEAASKAVSDAVAAKAAADQAAAQAAAASSANAKRSTSSNSGSSATKRSSGTTTKRSSGSSSSSSGSQAPSTSTPSTGSHYDWTKIDNTYACKPGAFCPIG
jgi:hypothetical protein